MDGTDGRSSGSQGEPGDRPSLWTLARVFVGLSLVGFGGPNAHLALMLDRVVDHRKWLDRARFLELMSATLGPTSVADPAAAAVTLAGLGALLRGWVRPGGLVMASLALGGLRAALP